MADGPGLTVVTGAARGIGAVVAVELAEQGSSLMLIDACADQPGIGYGMPAAADLEAVASRCLLAGAADVELVREDVAGEDAWSSMLEVNLHGTRRLAEATVPGMIAAGTGRFVAIASAAALQAMPGLAAYSAAKAAVVGYVRALAADLAGTGVAANVVCPGSTRGAMLAESAALYDLPDQDAFAGQQLLRRVLEPGEVAAAVVWLCGPGASAMTGAVIPVDGGLTS
jgi:NAD(P)-dependent dehydrogenase (short-subunit alcohol dehydrogenase family)